uniref:Uncharacterized protein n=1 Tax=Kwoniella dejecticola CBS 10117 TaxID=1296121 RepID=A0A1A6AEL4_9TREE|nr:uncharacterized protein I303_00306 [Kwoniella dejecticola CBS 10117]OBR88489.1 hypothetical protein I303_00306 [Kwoniella dejecticola CBS 10117]
MTSIASSSRLTRSSTSRSPLISLPLTTFFQHQTSTSTSSASASVSAFPSPVSLPTKRGLTPSEPSSPGGSKTRKVSTTLVDGTETIRKTRSSSRKGKERQSNPNELQEIHVEVGVTPKIRNVLNKDDLGTGKSPARRLFAGAGPTSQRESPIRLVKERTFQLLDQAELTRYMYPSRNSGISGAVSTPPKYHRGLAPSPPILDSPSNPLSVSETNTQSSFEVPVSSSTLTSTITSTSIEIDVQAAPSPELTPSAIFETDCGFEIYESTLKELREMDEHVASIILSSQESQGQSHGNINVLSRSNSPALSEIEQNVIIMDNQENIQPLPMISYPPSPKSKSQPRSNRSTPSKYSNNTTDDEEIISMYLNAPSHSPSTNSSISGSGTRRRERSKLINEVLLLRGESMIHKDSMDIDMNGGNDKDGEEEELTPGRKIVRGGRERLAREVDMA